MSRISLAPLAGLLGVAGVLTGLVLDDFPDGSMNDQQVAHWFAVHGTANWIISGAAIALGGTALLVFAAVVAARAEAAGAGPVAARLVHTSATAWAMLTMVGGAIWISPPVAVKMFDARPTAGLMYLGGAAYAVLVTVCAFAAAVLAATLTTVSRRTRLLPRWLTVIGYPAAVLMLTNVMLPMAVITLWFAAVTISLARRGEVRLPAPRMPAVPA